MIQRHIAEAIRFCPLERSERQLRAEACRELYQLLRQRLLRYLGRGTTHQACEDMLHEIYDLMIDAIEGDRIADLDAVDAYAFGIARNVRARALEKQARRMSNVISIDSFRRRDQPRDPRPDAEHDLIEREAAASLAGIFHQLLSELGPMDRRLVERFYISGHEPAAIAAAYGFTPSAFEQRMYRIRRKLKAAYETLNRLSPEDPPYKDAA